MSSPGFLVAKAKLAATGGSVERPMPDWLADIAALTAKVKANGTGVAFNGATPVGKQTLSAALPTDGTATNAAICTAINAIRAALIADGLGQ